MKTGTTELSFDGFGSNDKRDEYVPRIATFTKPEYGEKFGKLFETAPDMAEALKFFTRSGVHSNDNPIADVNIPTGVIDGWVEKARAALAKAGIK